MTRVSSNLGAPLKEIGFHTRVFQNRQGHRAELDFDLAEHAPIFFLRALGSV